MSDSAPALPRLTGVGFLSAAASIAAAWAGPVLLFGLAFCSIGGMTNQIHQWAHMPSPPQVVRALQAGGVLLGRTQHAAHHALPYDGHYCITTGWCNRPLEAIAFFRRIEWAITRLTGAVPREDDHHYDQISALAS